MNTSIIKAITGIKSNLSILSDVLIDNGVLKCSSMDMTYTCSCDLPDGMYHGIELIQSIKNNILPIPNKYNRKNDFPDLPSHEKLTWYPLNFNFFPMKKFVSSDTTQYTLQGVLFEKNKVIAIDGRKLLLKNTECEADFSVIIPYVHTIDHEWSDIALSYDCKTVFLRSSDGIVSVNVLSGKFPNYNMFIPSKHQYSATIKNNRKLWPIVKSQVDKESGHFYIGKNETGSGIFIAKNDEIKERKYSLDITGNDFIVAMGIKNFEPILETVGDSFTMHHNGNVSPIRIDNGSCDIIIIMQMKNLLTGDIDWNNSVKIECSPATRKIVKKPASCDNNAEIERLRAEIERLRTENDELKNKPAEIVEKIVTVEKIVEKVIEKPVPDGNFTNPIISILKLKAENGSSFAAKLWNYHQAHGYLSAGQTAIVQNWIKS